MIWIMAAKVQYHFLLLFSTIHENNKGLFSNYSTIIFPIPTITYACTPQLFKPTFYFVLHLHVQQRFPLMLSLETGNTNVFTENSTQ